jgi:hypothetical protein
MLACGPFGPCLLGQGLHPAIADVRAAFHFTVASPSRVGCGDVTPAAASRLLANIVEGHSIPGAFRELLEGTLGPTSSPG